MERPCRYHAEKGSARENGKQAEPSRRRGDGAAWQVCRRSARAQHSGRSVRHRVESVYDGTNKEQRRRASATRQKGDTHQKGNTNRIEAEGGAPPPLRSV